jgi:hypothetical protein
MRSQSLKSSREGVYTKVRIVERSGGASIVEDDAFVQKERCLESLRGFSAVELGLRGAWETVGG